MPAPLPFAKRKITKRTVPALVFLALLYGCSRPEAEDRLAAMRARGTLRWGGDMQGGEPYVFQDPGSLSGLRGFEVEIAGALARRLGLVAEFVQRADRALEMYRKVATWDGAPQKPEAQGRFAAFDAYNTSVLARYR